MPTKRLVLFVLLLLIAAPAYAQSSPVIAHLEEIIPPTNTDKFVWLDNDMLIFEPPPETPGDFFADEYHVSNGQITRLDPSPLYFVPTTERIRHYQMQPSASISNPYTSFRSPFPLGESPFHHVIYLSSLYVACGYECPDGIIMAGQNGDSLDDTDLNSLDYTSQRTYHTLSFYAAGSLRVHWARAADVAIVDVDPDLGIGSTLYYVDLRSTPFNQPSLDIQIDKVYANLGSYMLALSDDGTRVLYSVPNPDGQPGSKLMLWQVIPPPPETPWQVDVLPLKTVLSDDSADHPFVGANFIADDPHHIIVIDNEGIVRIDLNTGERIVLNPDINSQIIQLAVFSPDNTHVAVVTRDYDVEVLDTGIS